MWKTQIWLICIYYERKLIPCLLCPNYISCLAYLKFVYSRTADSKLNNFTRIEPVMKLLEIPYDTNVVSFSSLNFN